MTWTIADTAMLMLLAMVVCSAWCLVRGQMIAIKRKREKECTGSMNEDRNR